MNIEDYIRENPEHEVSVCMNVIASPTDKRLRVIIQHRQGPYRPKLLGAYVVDTFAEALENLKEAKVQ